MLHIDEALNEEGSGNTTITIITYANTNTNA